MILDFGLFRIFLLPILLLAFSCSKPTKTAFFDANSLKIETNGGITTSARKPISGRVFSLMSSKDTVFSIGFLNGKEQGISRYWYENGQLSDVKFYDNGHKIGVHKGWWSDGKRKYIFHFENDEYEGNQQEWDENGLPYRDMNYHLGHEEGQQRMWYDNGQMRSNYIIKNNRRYGLLGTKNCINVADSIPALRNRLADGKL